MLDTRSNSNVLDHLMLELARYPNFGENHMLELARYPNFLMLAHPYVIRQFFIDDNSLISTILIKGKNAIFLE